MFRAALSYQASFFGAFADVRPSAETIPPLLNAFRTEELLPGTFLEFGRAGPETRLRLASSNNEWLIDFEQSRIQVLKNPVKLGGKNMGDLDEFARSAHQFIGRILETHPRQGTRLSLVTKNLLTIPEGTSPEEALDRFAVSLPFYQENPPVDWQARMTSRVPTRIGTSEDLFNVITILSRERGRFIDQGSVEEFDGLCLLFDINTYQGNQNARFSIGDLDEFLGLAQQLRRDLCEQVRTVLHG